MYEEGFLAVADFDFGLGDTGLQIENSVSKMGIGREPVVEIIRDLRV